ncbi:MAG: hypothetical protein AVDCRST_MAG11-3381, partial [uncultured Gemmatimonadaceae bacterium]
DRRRRLECRVRVVRRELLRFADHGGGVRPLPAGPVSGAHRRAPARGRRRAPRRSAVPPPAPAVGRRPGRDDVPRRARARAPPRPRAGCDSRTGPARPQCVHHRRRV